MKEKLILGIDPGSLNAGFALIGAKEERGRPSSLKIYKTGTFKLASKIPFFERLSKLSQSFSDLVEDIENFEVALESLIHVKNVNSLAKLAQARGAILAALSQKTDRFYEYAPNLVKSTVSGYGLSSKKSLEKSLNFMFPEQSFSSHDESDALAIAICHYFQYSAPAGAQKTFKASTKKGSSLKGAFKHLLKEK